MGEETLPLFFFCMITLIISTVLIILLITFIFYMKREKVRDQMYGCIVLAIDLSTHIAMVELVRVGKRFLKVDENGFQRWEVTVLNSGNKKVVFRDTNLFYTDQIDLYNEMKLNPSSFQNKTKIEDEILEEKDDN